MLRLVSPGVGLFTAALPIGSVVGAGSCVGHLVTLGRPRALLLPAGVAGVVRTQPHERVRAPVGFGDLLYELEPIGSAAALTRASATKQPDGGAGLFLPAPQTGRFYHRPSPDDPPLVEAGQTIAAGTPIGLIEVMKTFTHVTYQPRENLPAEARIVRMVAGDGADVREGEALLEVAES